MAMPKIYIDACCIIEAVKGRRGLPLQHPAAEVDMIERIMRAANAARSETGQEAEAKEARQVGGLFQWRERQCAN